MKYLFYIPWLIPAFVGLILPQPGRSQNLSDIRFELLDEEDGLSNHLIYRMKQDASGFLWIATNDGLNRYDGYNFKIFRNRRGDSTSLRNDESHSIFTDKKGRLWVSYSDGNIGLFREDCQCFQHWQVIPPDSLSPSAILLNIMENTDDDILWFSGFSYGLNRYDIRTGLWKRYNLPNIHPGFTPGDIANYNTVNCMYEDPDGLLWLATINGLYSFNPKTEEFSWKQYETIFPGMSRSDCFNSITPVGREGLWLSSWGGGVSYFDLKSETYKTWKYSPYNLHQSFSNVAYGLLKKNDYEFWVATGDRGLGVFDTRSGRFQFVEGPKDAKTANGALGVAQILQTPDSVMFIICEAGMLKYNPGANLFRFRSLPIRSSQNNDAFNISKIVEDPKNKVIYFGTQLGNGLNVLHTNTGRLEAYAIERKPDPENPDNNLILINDLLLDRQERLWVLSRDYLYRFDPKSKQLIKYPDPFPTELENSIMTFKNIHSDADGDLWIITDQGGLYRFEPDKRHMLSLLNHPELPARTPPKVSKTTWDKFGRMWLLGPNVICRYDKRTNTFEWPVPDSLQQLAGNYVGAIATDRLGNVWAHIFYKGVLKIDIPTLEQANVRMLTKDDGLPLARIAHLSSDPNGNIWMSTIQGVLYIQAESMSYRIFNQASGVDLNYLGIRFHQDHNGAFYITSPGRYDKIDFSIIDRAALQPKVYIDKFSILNQEQAGAIRPDITLAIKPGQNFFSFDFGCIDFTNQSLNQFAYMLEGWDENWVMGGNRRYASYTNLDGGHYVFKVKVANREGVWSEALAIPVFIETPFYKQPWFAVLAALIGSGIIYALYLFRVRQIENTERLKTEFNRQLAETRLEALRAQMNPHFIFNCLNSINRYIIKSDIKTSSLYLTRFAKLIRLILDNSEHKKVVLSNELEALRLYIDMEALRFDHKFTFDIDVDPDVDADNIEIPPLLIQPYVENAIWHGLLHRESGGHLSVRIRQEQETLICDITDNGIGREKAMEYKSASAPTRQSVGMKLTQERLQITGNAQTAHGAQQIIDLYDEHGAAGGTKIVLTIPV